MLGRGGGVARLRAEGVTCGLGLPGEREREEEADRAGLGRAAGPAQKVGPRGGRWVWAGKLGLGLLWVFPFLFLFLFYFSLKLNYLNSKGILNSNPYEIKQLKQCISMNASTKLNLRKILITCETKTKLNAN